jgi:hypothetical protein
LSEATIQGAGDHCVRANAVLLLFLLMTITGGWRLAIAPLPERTE